MVQDQISVLSVSPVDDDHCAVQAILRRSNWAHKKARTIAEALQMMRSAPVSVVLCESCLPDGSWKDLLTVLKESDSPPRLILVSAMPDDCLWAEALNLGAFDVLMKPLDHSELFRVASLAARSRYDTALTPRMSLFAGAGM